MLIHNVTIVNEGRRFNGYVTTSKDKIAEVAEGDPSAEVLDTHKGDTIDGEGGMLLPGAIDCHVHFRDPGMTHKATIASESRAAIAGGVTSFIDMPNTRPATTTTELLEQKVRIAAATSAANYGFMIGATSDNLDELLHADYRRVAAVKVFMGSSTGNMLVDKGSALSAIFDQVDARIVVHAEDNAIIAENTRLLRSRQGFDSDDIPVQYHTVIRNAEACVRATDRALSLAERYGSRLHVAHLSTALETCLFPTGNKGKITAEVSPHHLLWTVDDYPRLGTRIKMNPSIKTSADREALRDGLLSDRISIVATDHAPHLLSEKEGGALKAVSGAPMVQFSLPATLTLFPAETAVEKTAHAPARLFGIEGRGFIRPGYFADMALVKKESHTVTDNDAVSLCGWTPMAGATLDFQVAMTIVNGNVAYRDGSFAEAMHPQALSFKN